MQGADTSAIANELIANKDFLLRLRSELLRPQEGP
jgi:hypothetical protein